MPLTINTNMASINAQRNLADSQSALATSLQRLSSGLRINSAKDDAAGLAIANRMTSQVNGLTVAARNANDGISLAQTAEGAMQTISDNLQRMRDLSVQAANASATSTDRVSINNEIQQLSQEIQRVATSTSFNGTKLLDGTFNAQAFQVGANAGDTISVTSITNMQTTNLGSSGTVSSATVTGTTNLSALSAGQLTLNGVQVGASVAGTGGGQGTASAYSIAAAINAVAATSGVSATANNASVTGVAATSFVSIAANTFSINGVNVGAVSAGGNAVGQGANVAAAINAISSQTGVTASANATNGFVTLTSADGRDVVIAGAPLTSTGLTSATTHGTVTLTSTNATINPSGITLSGGTPGNAGFTSGTTAFSASSTVQSISALSVLTATGATNAITSIDGALATVDSARGALGAYQNRFQSAIANLNVAKENLTASRSRIQDADFAHETAALSRNQILQQAGTAMLAQANSLPNGVMALLR